MRRLCWSDGLWRWTLAVAGLLIGMNAAAGQSSGPGAGTREIIIGGQPAQPPRFERCIEVQIGGDRGFGCLNEQLKREVDRVNPSTAVAPIDARSSDIRVGTFNEAGVRQQYGSSFGHSAYPFRPPPPVFAAPRR